MLDNIWKRQCKSESNPLNFLSKPKRDDHLLQILTNSGERDDIFSDRSLIKSQSNLVKIMDSLGRVSDYLEPLKKNPEGVINIDLLNELMEQTIIIVGQYHNWGIY